jgi:hypothetical protein
MLFRDNGVQKVRGLIVLVTLCIVYFLKSVKKIFFNLKNKKMLHFSWKRKYFARNLHLYN